MQHTHIQLTSPYTCVSDSLRYHSVYIPSPACSEKQYITIRNEHIHTVYYTKVSQYVQMLHCCETGHMHIHICQVCTHTIKHLRSSWLSKHVPFACKYTIEVRKTHTADNKLVPFSTRLVVAKDSRL